MIYRLICDDQYLNSREDVVRRFLELTEQLDGVWDSHVSIQEYENIPISNERLRRAVLKAMESMTRDLDFDSLVSGLKAMPVALKMEQVVSVMNTLRPYIDERYARPTKKYLVLVQSLAAGVTEW